ncbi:MULTISPECIES: hypothetical protein [unclassified Bradyrhizobium]
MQVRLLDEFRCTNMTQTDARSLQQIRQETEQTRASLTQTVEQLRHSVTDTAQDIRGRISPAAIKAEVSGFVRSRGEQLLGDVTTTARENPMQAVAVGASLAYPLFRLARTVPFPVWMIGAGLYLASSNSGKAATQKASAIAADLSDDVVRRARGFSDQIADATNSAKEAVMGGLDRVTSAGAEHEREAGSSAQTALMSGSERLRGAAESTGASVRSSGAELRDHMAGKIGAAAGSVRDIADGATSTGQRLAGAAKDSASETLRSGRETASDLGDRATKTFRETIEQNPLLVAGIGLLIGGVIASALPRTELEDDMVGETSSSVKRRVQTAASHGFEAAKDAAGEAARRAADQAEAEGLSADGVREGANDLGQRVRRVAEAAVTTAFEPPEDSQSSGFHGEDSHG